MRKRALSLLLALAMCLALLPTALADGFEINKNGVAYAVPGGNLYFDKATGTIVGADEGVREANIPAAIDGVAVTAIGRTAFASNQDLVSVTIPNSVTTIGPEAFYGSRNLTSITIPSSVTTIEGGAFMITGLTSVSVPDSVTSMGAGVFKNCASLTSVTLSKNAASIGNETFLGCGGLTSVTIPNGVTSIGDYAFMGCEGLTSITIPNSVTSIGDYAFNRCTSLRSATIGGGVASMGRRVFDDCDKLSSVTIMPGVTSIWKDTFNGCEGLTSVVIPEGVTTIETYALTGLTSVAIPASVTSIAPNAFGPLIKDVYYGGSEEQWNAIEIGSNYILETRATKHYNDVRGKFTDMKIDGFYVDAVAWAVEKGITNGKTAAAFAPNENCTNGQILTFLWRAAGEPESDVETPFEMKGNEYYYKAAKWAYENGMIGADFDHNTPCTRADAVNYIWRAAGQGAAGYDGRFTDIPADSPYATAVAWAVENGVTNGATATTFNPGKICNRGEIVTFLHRYFGK